MAILGLLMFLRRKRSFVQRVPPLASLLIPLGFLSLPVTLAIFFHRDVLNVLLRVLWLFVGAGFGEEIFFRGYIQSRVNQAFGRPWQVLGLQFGVGLIVSSLLFGFIHALNTVDYFSGRFEFAWLWWCMNLGRPPRVAAPMARTKSRRFKVQVLYLIATPSFRRFIESTAPRRTRRYTEQQGQYALVVKPRPSGAPYSDVARKPARRFCWRYRASVDTPQLMGPEQIGGIAVRGGVADEWH